MENTYKYEDLLTFCIKSFEGCGLSFEWSTIMGRTLLVSDLMGHTTHGLQLLWPYINQLKESLMTAEGEPTTIRESATSITWNGNFLPGPVLVEKGIDIGLDRTEVHPVFTMAIQESHHIACLAAYLERVTAQNKIILLVSSDPANRTVAPYGGLTGTYSPDPLAYGLPTHGDPILFDSSASTVANGQILQKHAQGEKFDGKWLMTADGSPTDDPGSFFAKEPATVLPLGGLSLGFKGFGYGILMEALTSGLAGSGRRNNKGRWTSSIFIQIINPTYFGGREAFLDEMQHFVDAAKESRPHPQFQGVRMPGERGLALKRKQMAEGITLHPQVIKSIEKTAELLGIPPVLSSS